MQAVGQRLYKQRLQKKLSIDEIAKETKINPNFLLAIERGEYNKLPSPAYAVGFVRNYADFLGLPKSEITALFRREFDEKKAFKVLPDSLTKTKEFPVRRIRFHQSLFVFAVFLILIVGFLLYQYRSAYLPPVLTIRAAQQSSSSRDIIISGTTDSNATVTIDNEPVVVNNSGLFSKKLTLFPGKSIVTVTSKNRFGKETVVRKEIVIK